MRVYIQSKSGDHNTVFNDSLASSLHQALSHLRNIREATD